MRKNKHQLRTTGQYGFTFFEVTLVFSILSILSFVPIKLLANMVDRYEINSEVERVRYAISRGRALARSNLQCVKVLVAPYQITLSPFETCVPSFTGPEPTEVFTFDEMISLEIVGPDSDFTFTTTGGTLETVPTYVAINSTDGQQFNIEILPVLGKVRLK